VVVVMVSPDGHRVEQVMAQRALSRPAMPMLRVCKDSYLVADCRTIEEVALIVDLATLAPE
jgi:hypothetical protein